MNYLSDITLGERYRDDQSGFEGIATATYFYQFGCERVNLESFNKKTNDIVSLTFDAPRLTNVATGKKATVTRTGGPGLGNERRSDAGAIR
jgi:hypothetical protein